MLKKYDEAYNKCTKCTTERTLIVQSLQWKKCIKCTKFTVKRTLSVQSVRWKSVQVQKLYDKAQTKCKEGMREIARAGMTSKMKRWVIW